MIEVQSYHEEDRSFIEFRRKVRSAEVLSAAIERLLRGVHFTGRVSIIIQNGRVLKSWYDIRGQVPDYSSYVIPTK